MKKKKHGFGMILVMGNGGGHETNIWFWHGFGMKKCVLRQLAHLANSVS